MKRYTYVCFIIIFNSLLSANIVIENAVIWDGESKKEYIGNTVSYTHLTLPTILLV